MHKVDNCILWANLKWAMIGYMLAYVGAVLHNEFTNGPKGWSLN